MDTFDLLIRHHPQDRSVAVQLSTALDKFGYRVRASSEKEEYDGIPWLVLWSPTSAVDDNFCWECAEVARQSGQQLGRDQVYVAATGGVRSRALFPEYGQHGPDGRPRLRQFDLNDWSGEVADEGLAPLVWGLPPPATPNENPPFLMPTATRTCVGAQRGHRETSP